MLIDEKIAMLEREQRRHEKGEEREERAASPITLSMDEIIEGIRKGSLKLPEKKELFFQTRILFAEQIPMIVIADFYPDKEETEDMVIYVNNEEQVGQTLIHLPEEMKDLTVDEWVNQIKTGIKNQGMYAEVKKVKNLPYMDYIIYRTPTGKGWIYNLIYRIHKQNRKIIGAYNCMEKDAQTYGKLLEAMILETQRQL